MSTNSASIPAFYGYDPSSAAAILFTVFLVISFLLHIYQCISTKTWIMIPVLIGGFLEASGYLDRMSAHSEYPDFSIGPYIIETFFLLLAPVFFTQTVILQLQQLMKLPNRQKCCHGGKVRLPASLLVLNAISFGLHIGGGAVLSSGFASKSLGRIHLGPKIIIGGLFLQLLILAVIITFASFFGRKMGDSNKQESGPNEIPWKRHIWTLIISSALIGIRTIFKTVEYFQGFSGYLLAHEVFVYVFDSLLMLGLMVLLNICHPSEIKAAVKGGKYIRKVVFLQHNSQELVVQV